MNREQQERQFGTAFSSFHSEVLDEMPLIDGDHDQRQQEISERYVLWRFLEQHFADGSDIEKRERMKRFFVCEERSITLGDLRRDNAIYWPSILVRFRLSPPLRMLLKYSDCVIQDEYDSILAEGVFRDTTAAESRENALETLRLWHTRLQAQESRVSFDVELLAQMKKAIRGNSMNDYLELIIQAFPHLKHDAIRIYLLHHRHEGLKQGHEDQKRIRQRLINTYDFNEEGNGAPLALVVLRSFLRSIEMSLYSRGGRLEEEELNSLLLWLRTLKKFDEVSFCRGKAAMLLFLLQNVNVDASRLAERVGSARCRSNWRKILQVLTQGGESIQRKDWNHHQLPLHLLLSRSLPGHDILVKQDILAGDDDRGELDRNKQVDQAGTKCPIEGLYPFQLAAMPKDYGVVHVSEGKRRYLDLEQLSQVYELMRVNPSRVVESHHSLERDREYVEALMRDSRESQILEQRKLKLKREEEKIAAEELRLVEQRRQTDQMPKYKKQRIY